LFQAGQYQNLIANASVDLAYFPNSHQLWNLLGLAKRSIGDIDGATEALLQSIEKKPDFAPAYDNLGNVLKDKGKHEDALKAFKIALSLAPRDAKTFNNLATLLDDLARYDEAEEALKNALALEPGFSDAIYNLGGLNLRKLNFEDGWRQREARWGRAGAAAEPLVNLGFSWSGEFVPNLFVWAEQGIGDEVMYASCIEALLSKCDNLTVSLSKRLIPLFQRSFPSNVAFVDRQQQIDNVVFDAQVPAMTAVGICNPNRQSFRRAPCPYLKADASQVKAIKEKLRDFASAQEIVGISWKSGNAKVGARRSVCPIELVRHLPSDVALVNLQYGDTETDLLRVRCALGREVHQVNSVNNFKDLDGLAALIRACDRVVSIDNSTVHLAGALGVDCHVLLPMAADWRWGPNGTSTSYWYDTIRLYWQSELGDWKSALDDVSNALITQPLRHLS